MKRLLITPLLLALGACAPAKYDLGADPRGERVEIYRREQGKPLQVTVENARRVLLVGNLGLLTRFDSEEAKARGYAEYVAAVRASQPDHERTVHLSREAFDASIGGAVPVAFYRLGSYTLNATALVPREQVESLGYPSYLAALFTGHGDLIGAATNLDGVFVVDQRLCARADAICAGNYQTGLFRDGSGEQINRKLARLDNGALIDPASYRVR
ncbi:hypothetical protein [Pseudomonas citronellolis]|uniref:hypothetical protein n=1 Tax=Pseudomonas citronellolis TaxID=53408 RepID=UPI0023E3965E|nr:hypothetical protein [Pseudomonas citronellolis]MDF3935798.1 hypothetical protein [Pseudomonas citronellolis]